MNKCFRNLGRVVFLMVTAYSIAGSAQESLANQTPVSATQGKPSSNGVNQQENYFYSTKILEILTAQQKLVNETLLGFVREHLQTLPGAQKKPEELVSLLYQWEKMLVETTGSPDLGGALANWGQMYDELPWIEGDEELNLKLETPGILNPSVVNTLNDDPRIVPLLQMITSRIRTYDELSKRLKQDVRASRDGPAGTLPLENAGFVKWTQASQALFDSLVRLQIQVLKIGPVKRRVHAFKEVSVWNSAFMGVWLGEFLTMIPSIFISGMTGGVHPKFEWAFSFGVGLALVSGVSHYRITSSNQTKSAIALGHLGELARTLILRRLQFEGEVPSVTSADADREWLGLLSFAGVGASLQAQVANGDLGCAHLLVSGPER